MLHTSLSAPQGGRDLSLSDGFCQLSTQPAHAVCIQNQDRTRPPISRQCREREAERWMVADAAKSATVNERDCADAIGCYD